MSHEVDRPLFHVRFLVRSVAAAESTLVVGALRESEEQVRTTISSMLY
jgi:hypothetical protein